MYKHNPKYNTVVLMSIEPERVLENLYSMEPQIYTGIPCLEQKDIFKLKIFRASEKVK